MDTMGPLGQARHTMDPLGQARPTMDTMGLLGQARRTFDIKYEQSWHIISDKLSCGTHLDHRRAIFIKLACTRACTLFTYFHFSARFTRVFCARSWTLFKTVKTDL